MNDMRSLSVDPSAILCGPYRLPLGRPLVMGVLNITPDSFFDGGRYIDRTRALERARQMLVDGADLIDVGGESTRPGATAVQESEEIERVVPLLEQLWPECDARGVPLSIDTRKPAVMRAAIDAGASMINDVSALRAPGAVETVAGSNVGVCLMHMQGEPATMQHDVVYTDLLAELKNFLRARAEACETAGIARVRIVIDPGFGFGKTVDHNLILLNRLADIVDLGYPVAVGLSRKSTIGVLTGRDVNERVAGSVAAALAAVARGASMVRVHDVRETVDALKVWRAANAGRR